MFGTEQVQTNWFNLSLPFILMSRGMLDICPQTASLFERLAMATLHVLPGARQRPHALTERDRDHPLYGVLPLAARSDIDPSLPFAARPIDISFFGTSSPRRDAFFARNAAFFADYETFNYDRRPGRGPIRSGGEDGALTRLAGHVVRPQQDHAQYSPRGIRLLRVAPHGAPWHVHGQPRRVRPVPTAPGLCRQ